MWVMGNMFEELCLRKAQGENRCRPPGLWGLLLLIQCWKLLGNTWPLSGAYMTLLMTPQHFPTSIWGYGIKAHFESPGKLEYLSPLSKEDFIIFLPLLVTSKLVKFSIPFSFSQPLTFLSFLWLSSLIFFLPITIPYLIPGFSVFN